MDYKNILEASMKKRDDLYAESCSAFRLFNSGGDGIQGLVIDRYGEYLLIQIFEEKVVPEKERIFESVRSVITELPFAPKGILYKRRDETASSQKEYRSELVWGEMPERSYHVIQAGVTAAVNLVDGLNTGLFLDMRSVRNELAALYASGMESMLNLFCYTGMFSVHALKNGLKRSCNVDISGTVLRRAKENYSINELRVDNRDFICEDSGVFLKKAVAKGKKYDIVVFDPPTFARNKHKSFSVTRDYAEYCDRIGMVSAGYVLSVVNTYTVSDDEYKGYHPSDWKLIKMFHESDDFTPEKNFYLKVGLWHI